MRLPAAALILAALASFALPAAAQVAVQAPAARAGAANPETAPGSAAPSPLEPVRAAITAAFAEGKFATLAPVLDPEVRVTTPDGRVLVGAAAVEGAFERLYDDIDRGSVQIRFEGEPEPLAPDLALVRGQTEDRWVFSAGYERQMPSRFTALMEVAPSGLWTVRTLHVSANLLDNPILDGRDRTRDAIAVGTFLAGAALGVAAGLLLGGRTRTPRAQSGAASAAPAQRPAP